MREHNTINERERYTSHFHGLSVLVVYIPVVVAKAFLARIVEILPTIVEGKVLGR